MKFWVGVTDKNWFEYLASISPDEVNFWKPGGQGFSAIEIGAPFLFKLHSPINKIVVAVISFALNKSHCL